MLLMQKTMKLGRSEEYEETVFLQAEEPLLLVINGWSKIIQEPR